MTEHEVSRTLVKSPPELWSECSDPASLARHLGESFGEIRITKLEPETAVAWEGERTSGTVRLEPSGWGTKVVLTARAETEEAPDGEAVAAPEPEGEAVAAPEPEPEPAAASKPAPEPEPVAPQESVAHPAPEPVSEPAPPKRRLFKRLRALFGPEPDPDRPIVLTSVAEPESAVAPEPELETPREPAPELETPPEPAPELETPPEPEALDSHRPDEIAVTDTRATQPVDADAALTAALDSLGQAHHRPFSRS